MGFPPPPSFPDPTTLVSVDISFPPSPTLPSICGFSIPFPPKFSFAFVLPPFPFPPTIPIPFFTFALSCDLSNPIDISAGLKLPFGGGRVQNNPPDPDSDNDSF